MNDTLQYKLEGTPFVLTVDFYYWPEEAPVYHGPAVCAGAPEEVEVRGIRMGGLSVWDALRGYKGYDEWERETLIPWISRVLAEGRAEVRYAEAHS